MVFSSIAFIYYFLPFLFLVYFIVPRKFRNNVLLVFSLLFYYIGEEEYLILLMGSCLVNYLCGLCIEKYNKRVSLILGLIFNLGLLLYFKYTNFFIDSFNNIFNLNIGLLNIVLPLGISFFTFQNISYIVDVYRGEVKAQKNILTYSTYITLFPQLVAGPIVRYKDINDELVSRKENFNLFSEGVKRFVIGLSKKVLIADNLFNMINLFMSSEMSAVSYFIVALGYTLQIYYDFSGYSDMAIGLGKMFGFNFKENFNYPLISSSITEFWKRWHMSLSSFFKDYVYIPLGGNRKGIRRLLLNLLVVWFLTGLWHGDNFNFIIWGLYFFLFLVIEKLFLGKYLKKSILSYAYTFVVIIISFVIFNITDINEIIVFIKGMFSIGVDFINFESLHYLKSSLGLLIIALIGIGPLFKNVINYLKKGNVGKVINVLEVFYYLILLIMVTASLVSSSFNPFIYFRF